MTTNHSQSRSGINWLGILVVVGVVVFLGLLLLPALSVPGRRPPPVRTLSEIKQFEAAIAAFKAKFGTEPPSRIILHEKPSERPYDFEGVDVHSRIEQRTVELFKLIWPEFPIETCLVAEDTDWVDFNSNGRVDNELDLDGAECLVFFLGGMFQTGIPTGFSKYPGNPFLPDGKRDGPFIDFDSSRFVDRDQDGFLEYVDRLPKQSSPYVYFSSYGGAGYNSFQGVITSDNGTFLPYFSSGDPAKDLANVQWYRQKSVQIISPGKDGKLGVGGLIDPADSKVLLPSPADADNLTNFWASPLKSK